MKRLILVATSAAMALGLGACTKPSDPNLQDAAKIVSARLQASGKLCLSVPDIWPVDIAKSAPTDEEHRPKILRQLEVLEKVGMVRSSDAVAWKDTGSGYVKSDEAVRRYEVSDAGKPFFRATETPAKEKAVGIQRGQLCYARTALDKVVSVDNTSLADGTQLASITYTYKTPIVVNWVRVKEVFDAYGSAKDALAGAGKTEAKMPLVRVSGAWQIFEPGVSADHYRVRH